jgi:SAM-dependent methyltransferase
MPTAERALLHRGGRSGTWGNLGLWREGEGDDYAGACTALARAVADAAGLRAGDAVLDLACGAGDELQLWLDAYGAGRVHGVELDPALAQAARQRLGLRATVHQGSALAPAASRGAAFDRVLCVDAAYHLRPRAAFLQTAWQALKPGGTLAYTDLCLHPAAGARGALVLRAAARLCGLAADDLLDAASQRTRLESIGFAGVQLRRLDDAVLGGFARFVGTQGPRVMRTALHRDWRRPFLTAKLIGPCRRAGLGYLLLTATRPGGGATAAIARATAWAERTALSSKGTPASA